MRRAALLALSLLCASARLPAQDLGYRVAAYVASFELIAGSPDVLVTLRITYLVGDYAKSDGFKYVGYGVVTDLRCTDGLGKALVSRVIQEEETRLQWFFPTVKLGDQSVIVQFRLHDFLGNGGGYVAFDAPWVGVFRVPVDNAIYELILPGSEKPTIRSVQPRTSRLVFADGAWKVVCSQAILVDKAFAVDFASPYFVTKPYTTLELFRQRGGFLLLGVGAAVAGLLAFVVVRAIRNPGSGAAVGAGTGADYGGGGCGGGCGGGGGGCGG